MCGLFSLLQLRWKQHLLALKEAAHWATGGLGWVAVFWILNLHEFEWVSLTEIILSWSLINILIYTLKYHVVQRSCATPHFFILFDSIFATRSQLTVIFLSGDKNMCPGFLKTPWKLCSAPWLIFFNLCSVKFLYLTFFNGMLYFLVNTDLYIQFKLILHN